jgi:hypothetical protein
MFIVETSNVTQGMTAHDASPPFVGRSLPYRGKVLMLVYGQMLQPRKMAMPKLRGAISIQSESCAPFRLDED